MRIPILYLIDYLYQFAGTEKHLYYFLEKLDKKRYEPFVFAFEGFESFKKNIEDLGIYARILNMKKVYGVRPFRYFFELRKFIKGKKIKIIQTFHTNADIYGTVLAKISDIPIIISSRRDMGFNRNRKHIICYKFLNKYVDKIICVSEAVKKIVMREEHVPEFKIQVIYNGIDKEDLDRKVELSEVKKKLGFLDSGPIIGMIANFNPIKGHRYFIEAALILRKQVKNIQFILVGSGRQDLVDDLKGLVKELGLNDCVHLLGHREDILNFLSIMDILVAPSLSEGFSNSIIEAMYLRKPVVATDVGGNPEVVIHNLTGILIPPANVDGIAQAVMKLLKEPNLAAKLGENAKRLIEEKFLFERMLDETTGLYESLLAQRGLND